MGNPFNQVDLDSLNRRKARIKQLEQMLGHTKHLSREEYCSLLKEIRHNYVVLMCMRSVTGTTLDTSAYMGIIEKTHYLLDSAEGRPQQTVDIRHKIETENRLELRKILSDPANIGDILSIESVILEKLSDA